MRALPQALLSLAAIATVSAPAFGQQSISIAATGQTSSYYAYHAAVAQVIGNAYPDINVTVMETGGSVENLRLIERGQADWGQFVEPTFYEDYAAVGSAAGNEPRSDLRVLWAITEIALFNVVNANEDIHTMGDLAGRPYGAGSAGSLTERITADLLATIGAEPELVRGGYSDLVAAMQDRRIVGYTKSGSLTAQDATVMDVQTAVPIRIIGFSDDDVAAIQEVYPHYTIAPLAETPYGDGPVNLYRTALIVGATAALDEDIAYRSFRAVAENMDEIAATFRPVAGVDLIESTLAVAEAPLHPGVIRYMEEQGHTVPDELRPPQ